MNPTLPAPAAGTALRHRAKVLFGSTAAVLLIGLALAGPAGAHATVESSTPQDGAEVAAQPASVLVRFDEAVGLVPSAEQVISATGVRADTGAPRLEGSGTTLVLPLKTNLPRGTYSAVWRVVSADTHVVSGSVTFGLGARPTATQAVPADRTGALTVADQAAQGIVYAGAVLLVGMLTAVRLLWPSAVRSRRVRAAARTGWAGLLAGTLMQLLLQGPRAVDGDWSAFVHLQGLGQSVNSPYGRQLLARAALLIAITPLLRLSGAGRRPTPGPPRTRTWIGAAAGLGILVAVAVTGHESVGPYRWSAYPAAVIHLAAMSVWLGGLAALALAVLPDLRAGRLDVHRSHLESWSKLAYACVVVLVISGEDLAWRQIRPLPALWSTRYGITLLIKTGLVAVMVALAHFGHRHIARARLGTPGALPAPADLPGQDPPRPALRTGSAGTTTRTGPARTNTAATRIALRAPTGSASRVLARRLARSVAVEASTAALVLAATAVLVSQAPARTTYGPPATLSAPLGPDHARVHIDTTRRGPQHITVDVLDAHDRPVASRTLTATLSSREVAALTPTMARQAADATQWASQGAVAPLPGVWTLTLDVGLDSDDAYTTAVTYQVW